MIRSLQVKLAASHILPILALMPVLTLYLLYTLHGFFNQIMLRQVRSEAYQVSDALSATPLMRDDHDARQILLSRAGRLTGARLFLISSDGIIVATSRDQDAGRVGTEFKDDAVRQALAGREVEGVGPGISSEIAYAVIPLQTNGTTRAALRLSYEMSDVQAELGQLERIVLGGIALTMALGLGLGLGLALTITRPLHRINRAARLIAAGEYSARAMIHSQDEIGTLANNFDLMAERLEEAELSRGRQLAAIVHEVARPLAGMQAAVDTLLEGAEPDADARHALLSGISDELERLQRMTDSLQDLQKRTLRPLPVDRKQISLDRILRASVASFQSISQQRDINLYLELRNSSCSLFADEDRIIQVVTNLLDNAFKFTPPGGTITVQSGQDGRGAWVSISDTGCGIAPQELPHLFHEFYRGDRRHPPEKRGMGLGLAICRDIVNAHGGTIEAESSHGRGTCITFTLPIHSDPSG